MDFLFSVSYLGLFLSSFIAATIVPFSSEAVLTLMVSQNYDIWICITVASFGNWLGGLTNYFLGRLGNLNWINKFSGIREKQIEKAKKQIVKYGALMALLCWMPVVGDVFAIVLGLGRYHWFPVSAYMLLGKSVRYVIWAFLSYSVFV